MLGNKSKLVQGLTKRGVQYVREMRDVRVLGLTVFVGIALLVTWSGVGIIQTNYALQQRISRLEQENALQALENSTLGLRNEYYNTDQYLELQARKQFSRGAPGEKLLLVPRDVALRSSKDFPEPEEKQIEKKPSKPKYQQNFEAWMEFLFRRNAQKT